MSEQLFNKFWGLAIDNVAAVILGGALMLWYLYVKLQLDDKIRDGYKTLLNIESVLEKMHGKDKSQ